MLFEPLDGRPLGDSATLIDELRFRPAAAAAAQGIDPAKTQINAWHLARAFRAELARALATVFPPEEGRIDLAASYPGGFDGKPVTAAARRPRTGSKTAEKRGNSVPGRFGERGSFCGWY